MNRDVMQQSMNNKSIFDMPLRVTFYARVSTDSNEQSNSLTNQIAHYTNLIKSKPNWTFVPGYVDKGISAATVEKREEFQRMLLDAKNDAFDLIITKEITRFARNTLDSIMYTRELLTAGVGVLFENDGINTFDEDSELRLTIMSGIAQDELRKLSSRVKFGHKQAIKNGVVLGNSRIFGYVKDNGRLIIDEEEAKMVRLLFEMYATGKYSMKQIEDIFWARGYRNHNGNKIAHTTMSGIISNPKYKGYYVGNKVKIVDLFSKKQKFLPPEEWVMFKDETGKIVPAIVSEELWQQANEVLRKRSEEVKQHKNISNRRNLLTGKLFCAHCGVPYYRRESAGRNRQRNSKWVCSNKVKNGTDTCPSFGIFEEDIFPILIEVLSGRASPSCSSHGNDNQELERIEAEIEMIGRAQQKLFSHRAYGSLEDNDFARMHATLKLKLEDLQHKRDAITPADRSPKDSPRILDEMHTTFSQTDIKNKFALRALVDKYIASITATLNQDGQSATLDIHTVTGDIFCYTVRPRRLRRESPSR